MALYDGLPLNTPTKVGGDNVTFELWATRTVDGGSVETRLIGATATAAANQQTITQNVANAITRLRAIKTQADTFGAQAPYAAANLAALNDLLAKAQLIAGAVGDLAVDLNYLARFVSNQFDATT